MTGEPQAAREEYHIPHFCPFTAPRRSRRHPVSVWMERARVCERAGGGGGGGEARRAWAWARLPGHRQSWERCVSTRRRCEDRHEIITAQHSPAAEDHIIVVSAAASSVICPTSSDVRSSACLCVTWNIHPLIYLGLPQFHNRVEKI